MQHNYKFNDIKPLNETEHNSNLTINNLTGNNTRVKLYGNTYQQLGDGSNLLKPFNYGERTYFSDLSSEATPVSDNWLSIKHSTNLSPMFINMFIGANRINNLKPSTTYTVIVEFSNVNIVQMNGYIAFGATSTNLALNVFTDMKLLYKQVLLSNKPTAFLLHTGTDVTKSFALRNFQRIESNDELSYNMRLSFVEGDITNEIDNWQYQYPLSIPTVEYPVKIESVGTNTNLLDQTNLSTLARASGIYINASGHLQSIYTTSDTREWDYNSRNWTVNLEPRCIYNIYAFL